MAERHLDALFAPAIDGRLDPTSRRRFDGHIAECDRCAAAFAEHCAASEALRSLPAARMPVAIRLPMHAPRSAREAWLERFRPRSPWALSLTGLAAAAAVVLVFTVALNRGSATPASNSQQALAGGGAASASSFSASSSAAGNGSTPANVAPNGVAGSDARFNYAVTAPRPGQPGESLVVATDSQTYAPGDQVEVNARLVQSPSSATTPAPARPGAFAPSSDFALLPVLAEPSVSLLAPRAAAAPQPDQAGVPESPSPIAATRSSAGIFTLTIPATAVRGQVLTIVATVPAGVPSSSDSSAVTVALQITVA